LRLAAADDRSVGGGALYVAHAQRLVRVEKAVGERSDEQVRATLRSMAFRRPSSTILKR
jgi:hypothetical protein